MSTETYAAYTQRIKDEQIEKVIGQRLPFNAQAERAVLSALLLNDESIQHVPNY